MGAGLMGHLIDAAKHRAGRDSLALGSWWRRGIRRRFAHTGPSRARGSCVLRSPFSREAERAWGFRNLAHALAGAAATDRRRRSAFSPQRGGGPAAASGRAAVGRAA